MLFGYTAPCDDDDDDDDDVSDDDDDDDDGCGTARIACVGATRRGASERASDDDDDARIGIGIG